MSSQEVHNALDCKPTDLCNPREQRDLAAWESLLSHSLTVLQGDKQVGARHNLCGISFGTQQSSEMMG